MNLRGPGDDEAYVWNLLWGVQKHELLKIQFTHEITINFNLLEPEFYI